MKKVLNCANIDIGFKPGVKLCNIFHQHKVKNKCGAIYCIKCKDCDSPYIGETGRHFNKRLNEHTRAIIGTLVRPLQNTR